MRRLSFALFIVFLDISSLSAYDWPIKEDTVQHRIYGTLGEWRSSHFHAGVDVGAPESTKVYTIEGDTCYMDTLPPIQGINIGHFRYYHMVIRDVIDDTFFIAADSFFAKTDSCNHVHLQEADRRLTAPGASANNAVWLNPLRNGAMTPYVDFTNPSIDSIKFYRQGPGDTLLSNDSLDGRIDVLAVARDTRTDSTGHIPTIVGTTSVYRIGYEVRDTLGNLKKDYWKKIVFDSIPSPPNVSQLQLTYGTGSTNSHFRYWISNDPFNDTVSLRNHYWNTKQRADSAGIPFPDSVDADSIEVAKFKDGFYWVKVKAYDVRNNADSESVLVHIDNFAPRVKQTYPSDWFAFVSNKQHKIWCCFSEAMDTTTLTAENIKIQSLKADSFNYPIINISYIQVDSIPLYKLLLEVDSFRFKDTVQVRLSDSIRDLAGKSIDTTDSKQTIAYSWTFFVGVIQLTDNDLNDIQPDVYHNKIVWTQALADSYLGEIMLYDFYNNTTDTISPGGGEHNYPVIWQNKVVWRRYPDDYTNPIYYYDGTSVTIVASGNRGRNIYDIDSSGIALRSYYGNGYPDTTWIEYY
ncbi:MAG TPA: hypothetical protein ENI34_04695, partial [candidate division WOR-3 bacterium]|nr:hypothetical protein [candidate division WOR-3 bacterium]